MRARDSKTAAERPTHPMAPRPERVDDHEPSRPPTGAGLTEASPASILRLQRQAGNRSVSAALTSRGGEVAVQRQGGGSTTVTFSDTEGSVIEGSATDLGPSLGGGNVDGFVQDKVVRVAEALRSFQAAWLGGLDDFTGHQIFASSSEAEPRYGEAVLKYAFKSIVKEVVHGLGERIPGFDKAYELTFGLIEELDKEHERVEKAQAQVEMKGFIGAYRQEVTDSFNARIATATRSKSELLQGFQRAVGEAPRERGAVELATPRVTTGQELAIAGPGAQYLNELTRKVSALEAAVPKEVACLQAISEAWVGESAGEVASKGGGEVYINGRIYLGVDVSIGTDGAASVTAPTSARLAAPSASKVVDALMEAMRKQNHTINDLSIEKALTINIEVDSGHWYSTNDRYQLHVWYIDPESPTQVEGPIPIAGTDFDPHKAGAVGGTAYRAAMTRAILGVTKLEAY